MQSSPCLAWVPANGAGFAFVQVERTGLRNKADTRLSFRRQNAVANKKIARRCGS